jgi:hypothetical protein
VKSSRRGFLFGLGAALVTAPSIVHACNIMPIKVMDSFHKVWINGRDLQMNPITKIIEVRDSLIHGLDMAGYKTECDLIQPEFLDVQSIVWSNEINKVDISPAVDQQIKYQKAEREFIDQPPNVGTVIRNPMPHIPISGFIPGMVHRGQTVTIYDEADSHQG